MKLAFIGFGEVGLSLAHDLAPQDVAIAAYRRHPEQVEPQARELGVRLTPELPQALDRADLVLSCVWPRSAVDVAHAAAEHLRPGQLFADLNSISPATAERDQQAIEPSGAGMAKIGVMDVVHGVDTPMVVGGPAADSVCRALEELGFHPRLLGADVRAPAAFKILRSYLLKSISAAGAEMTRAAAHYGLTDEIANSAAEFLKWPGYAAKLQSSLSSMRVHAARRAQEMEEAIDTLREAGLDTQFAEAVQQVYARLAESPLSC